MQHRKLAVQGELVDHAGAVGAAGGGGSIEVAVMGEKERRRGELREGVDRKSVERGQNTRWRGAKNVARGTRHNVGAQSNAVEIAVAGVHGALDALTGGECSEGCYGRIQATPEQVKKAIRAPSAQAQERSIGEV